MTPEELLKPRRKVIAPFPGMHFIGEGGFSNNEIFYPEYKHERYYHNGVDIDNYPHLFKNLEWWEERKPEDMPEYYKIDGKVFKWEPEHGLKCCIARGHVLPATKEEYEAYTNQLNTT